MGNNGFPEGKYMTTVKVGPKGQIVIPAEVREMFGIAPGDQLLLQGSDEPVLPGQHAFHRRIRLCMVHRRQDV